LPIAAQLDTPLVERIDIPDHALREDFVLVHSRSTCRAFAAVNFLNRMELVGRLPGKVSLRDQFLQRLGRQLRTR